MKLITLILGLKYFALKLQKVPGVLNYLEYFSVSNVQILEFNLETFEAMFLLKKTKP